MVKLFVGFVVLILVGLFFLVVNFHDVQTNNRDVCSEAGGIPIFGDKGHFKVCLRPEAVIEMPRN